jgi:hypothetical protein
VPGIYIGLSEANRSLLLFLTVRAYVSFVNYDREGDQPSVHSRPQDGFSPNTRHNWLDSYEVAANGFLRPKMDPGSNTVNESSSPQWMRSKSPTASFSALGNAAATPVKAKSQQERQLISDRDFRDIIEACKPRISGMRMPSALTSLLKLHQLSGDMEKARLSGVQLKVKKSFDGKDLPLREWGTVDFSESQSHSKPKATRSNSPIVRKASPEYLVEKSEESGDSCGSNSSGFASHVSSMLSMSYDRVLWDHCDSPSTIKKSIQIQRSPSMDFDQLHNSLPLDSDTAFSEEDSMSIGTDTASRSSTGRASVGAGEAEWTGDNDTNASRVSKREKHGENLRRMMEAHDTRSCALLSSQVDAVTEINLVRPDSNNPGDSELNTPRSGILYPNL